MFRFAVFLFVALCWINTFYSVQAFSIRSVDSTTPAPVYITIGPPCCGKTEALRSHLLSAGYDPDVVFSRDVALDEQSSVYHRVPLAAFLFPYSHLDASTGKQTLQASGCTVQDRLLDPSYDLTDQELRAVILRLAGRITPAEFEERAKELTIQAADTVPFFQRRRRAVAKDLMAAVEEVVVQAVGEVICGMQLKRDAEQHHDEELPYEEETGITASNDDNAIQNFNATQAHLLSARQLIRTPHVDLFVPQAIFHGGIDDARTSLTNLLKSNQEQPVSWGNTNTRPTEYTAALEAAQEAGRPVKFVAWGTHRLPKTTRQELLRRNVARFRTTGRYIPAGAIGAALGRVESLMKEARKEATLLFGDEASCPPPNVSTEEWQDYMIDVGLADLAGFQMDEEGFVVQVGEPKHLRPKSLRAKRKSKEGSNGRQQVDSAVERSTTCEGNCK